MVDKQTGQLMMFNIHKVKKIILMLCFLGFERNTAFREKIIGQIQNFEISFVA